MADLPLWMIIIYYGIVITAIVFLFMALYEYKQTRKNNEKNKNKSN